MRIRIKKLSFLDLPHFELHRNICDVNFSPSTYPFIGFSANHKVVTSSQGGDS